MVIRRHQSTEFPSPGDTELAESTKDRCQKYDIRDTGMLTKEAEKKPMRTNLRCRSGELGQGILQKGNRFKNTQVSAGKSDTWKNTKVSEILKETCGVFRADREKCQEVNAISDQRSGPLRAQLPSRS